MTPYQNLTQKSNIVSYEITEDSIHVVFRSGICRNYLYNYSRPGKPVVDHMKVLAVQGYGLNSYIGTAVRNSYSRKW